MKNAPEDKLLTDRNPEDQSEATQKAEAYLDLWEKNVCLTITSGDLRARFPAHSRKQ